MSACVHAAPLFFVMMTPKFLTFLKRAARLTASSPGRLTPARSHGSIEMLESRIAPASLVSSKVLTYHDADGDLVTVTFSKGLLNSLDVGRVFHFANHRVAGQLDQQLQTINIDDLGARAASLNITVSVMQKGGGDGFADVGYIESRGINLGAVSVHGDLGRIDAGAGAGTAPGLSSLNVNSMGERGVSIQQAGGTLSSNISGGIGSLQIATDIDGASISVGNGKAPSRGNIGSVAIGGSIFGGTSLYSGSIRATGDIGPVTVGGDVNGGSGANTGTIGAAGTMGDVTITGSINGGGGNDSGVIRSTGNMGFVTIGGNITGGTAQNAAAVGTAGTLDGVHVSGDVTGGSDAFTGVILSTGDMGAVQVDGSLQGGDGANSGVVGTAGALTSYDGAGIYGGAGTGSGSLTAAGNIGTVNISNLWSGTGANSGAINAGGTLGDVTVQGSILGSTNTPLSITSGGTMGSLSATNMSGAGVSSGGDIGTIALTTSILNSRITAAGSMGDITANGIPGTAGIDSSIFIAGATMGNISAIAGGSSGIYAIINSAFDAGASMGDITATGDIGGSLFVAGINLGSTFANDLSGAGHFDSATAAGFGFGFERLFRRWRRNDREDLRQWQHFGYHHPRRNYGSGPEQPIWQSE